MLTRFSTLLHSGARDGEVWRFPLPEDWMQGRSAFGGLQVAFAVQAMRELVPELPLRVLQATFLAPVPLGEVEVRARVLRTGKSAIHVEARVGTGELQALVIAVFGAGRPSVARETPARTPAVLAAEPITFPYIPGVVPAFTQHFSVRWLRGNLPFMGEPSPHQVVEVSLSDSQDRASDAHLVAIADFMPPMGLSYVSAPVPGSTVTWMLEPLRDRFDDLPLVGWTVDATLVAARDGYTSQSVTIWAPDGTPAALSQQHMIVFG